MAASSLQCLPRKQRGDDAAIGRARSIEPSVNYNELTTSEPWKSWLDCGKSSPFMAARFRLVNYYTLPRNLAGIEKAKMIVEHDLPLTSHVPPLSGGFNEWDIRSGKRLQFANWKITIWNR